VSAGRVPSSVWHPEEVGFVRNGKEEVRALVGDVFATPKPERLMQRIIEIASDPGDLVLDCFAGSGSTAAVAHKTGRRWTTIEWSHDNVDVFTAPRLKKVVSGEDRGGISEAVDWKGGGGFRVLDVASSMYAEDAGVVVLADWATNGALAEAVAAQLGFTHEPDGPFAGRKGRMRLAVLDGHANADVARTLIELLDGTERLTLCATSLDPEVGDLLRRLRAGSRVRVVPEDLLVAYATASPWRVSVANELEHLANEGKAAASDEADTEGLKDDAQEAVA
jgi:adenine-specific DNA-methyltransferase